MFLTTLSAVVLGATGLHAQTQAVTAPPQVTVTNVIVSMTPKPGVERDDVMKVMPDEIRETVQLYLKGKIEQWYFRGDGGALERCEVGATDNTGTAGGEPGICSG